MNRLLITMLVVAQAIGIITFLRFKAKLKKLEKENKIISGRRGNSINSSQKPVWEELGLSKEEYEESKSIIYGMNSNASLYNPILDDIHIDETIKEEQIDEEETTNHIETVSEETSEDEALRELTGIENVKELEDLQKKIEQNKNDATDQPLVVNQDVDPFLEENEEIIKRMIEQQEVTTVGNEEESSQYVNTSVGEDSENLFNDLLNMIETEDKNTNNDTIVTGTIPEHEIPQYDIPMPTEEDYNAVLFSDKDSMFSHEVGTEIPLPPTDEYISAMEMDYSEHDKMIAMLNLIDKESNRLGEEYHNISTEGAIFDDKEIKKQNIAAQLAELTDDGEGTKNMNEIVKLLIELYELEGKTEDMKALREEYREYFPEGEINVRIYEEDVIKVGKDEEIEDTFDIPQKYLWMATNQISDGLLGEQRWVGKCIGKNKTFIHFRDMSQRIWINVGEEQINKIDIDDLIAVFVERSEDSIVSVGIQHIKKNFE